jgi:AcrR family transcriptional regulator
MQQRSEETRNRILEAALQQFSQSGYDASGVAEICEAAGVSKGAFYHHFPSKHAVFLELLHRWLNELFAGLQFVRDQSKDVPLALQRMTEMARGVFLDADGRLSMFLEFWIQAKRDPLVWKETIAPYHQAEAFFASFLQQGIEQKSLRSVDPDLAARALISLAIGALLQDLLDPQGADWAQVVQESVSLLFTGLERKD